MTHLEAIVDLSWICGDLISQVESQYLCTNQSFWNDKACNKNYTSSRCLSNYPGKCTDFKTCELKVVNSNDVDFIEGNMCSLIFSLLQTKFSPSNERAFCENFTCKKRYEGVNASHGVIEPTNIQSVHQDFVCDGNIDCLEVSDENQALCKQCPRDFGHPPGKSKSATLSCRHRYTKGWICAVPCDGVDDLCENFEDENCSENTTLLLIGSILVLIILTILLGNVVFFIEFHRDCEDLNNKRANNSKEQFSHEDVIDDIENNYFILDKLIKMLEQCIQLKNSKKIDQILKYFFYQEFLINQKNWKITLINLKKKFLKDIKAKLVYCWLSNLSNQNSEHILYKLILSKVFKLRFLEMKSRMKTHTKLLEILEKLNNHLISIFHIMFYYLDVIKDIFVVVLIFLKVQFSSSFFAFSIQVLLFNFLSIVIPQVIISIYIICIALQGKISSYTCIVTLVPLMCPAITIFFIGKLKCNIKLLKNESRKSIWRKRLSLFKMIEATFENSIQILISFLVILLKYSNTKTIHGMENLIRNDEIGIFVMSLAWSIISIAFTEMQWQSSRKSYLMPKIGKLIIGINSLLAVLTRAFGIIIFLAPSMGLLNLQHHWQKSQTKWREENLESKNWKSISQYFEMTNGTVQFYFLCLISILIFHLVLVTLIKIFMGICFNDRKHIISKVFHVFTNLSSAKVFQDWDENVTSLEEVDQNYKKVKKEMKTLLTLMGLENVLMCTPIWILYYNICKRNVYLDKYFPQLDVEIYSTQLAYKLSIICPIIFTAVPFLQYWLFILYNKFGHPWKQLLQENPKAPKFLLAGDFDGVNVDNVSKYLNELIDGLVKEVTDKKEELIEQTKMDELASASEQQNPNFITLSQCQDENETKHEGIDAKIEVEIDLHRNSDNDQSWEVTDEELVCHL